MRGDVSSQACSLCLRFPRGPWNKSLGLCSPGFFSPSFDSFGHPVCARSFALPWEDHGELEASCESSYLPALLPRSGNGICLMSGGWLTLPGTSGAGGLAKDNILAGGVRVAGRRWLEWEEQKKSPWCLLNSEIFLVAEPQVGGLDLRSRGSGRAGSRGLLEFENFWGSQRRLLGACGCWLRDPCSSLGAGPGLGAMRGAGVGDGS